MAARHWFCKAYSASTAPKITTAIVVAIKIERCSEVMRDDHEGRLRHSEGSTYAAPRGGTCIQTCGFLLPALHRVVDALNRLKVSAVTLDGEAVFALAPGIGRETCSCSRAAYLKSIDEWRRRAVALRSYPEVQIGGVHRAGMVDSTSY
jgi:hypothetical protein